MAQHAKSKTAEDYLLQVTRQTAFPTANQMKMKLNPCKQSRRGTKTVWLIALHDTNLQKGLERLSARPSLPEHHESMSHIDPATANTRDRTQHLMN